jgi:hypothetical protein
MIVMTDGDNSYYTPQSLMSRSSSYNKSTYGSYGLTKSTTVHKNGRLFMGYKGNSTSSPRHTRSNFKSAMNELMLDVCANAKKDGIKIYSVAFNVSRGSSIKKRLNNCASINTKNSAKLYFDATGSKQLLAAFKAIGTDISNLRIAR